jgi:hypothetical protein
MLLLLCSERDCNGGYISLVHAMFSRVRDWYILVDVGRVQLSLY